jgi:hypothetical protein
VIALAHPKRVVLLRSLARGEKHVHDIEMLVIVSDDLKVRDVSALLQREARRGGISLDLLLITESDVAELAFNRKSVVYCALKEGKDLHVA